MLRSSLLCLALAVPAIAADELYDLRGPAPEKGQVYVLTAKSVGKDVTRTIKAMGNSIEQKFDEETMKKKEVEVLGVTGHEITRMRTKILDDQRDEIFRKGKRQVKKSLDREMKGQIVYSERTAKGWKNSLEDVTPTDAQKRQLKDFVPFKDEDIFYPAEKVKVGHAWKIPQDQFEKVLGHQMEDFKGSGTAKFLRVEKLDGEDVAVLEINFEMSGKSNEDDLTLDVKITGKGTVYRSLKHGFDRKSTTVTTMKAKGDGEANDQKIEVEFSGTMTAEDLVELKAKK